VVQDTGGDAPRTAGLTPAVAASPSLPAVARPSASRAPTATRSTAPTRPRHVTLRSDLAFGFNSSTLSPAAETAIARVAHQVRRAGLSGRIRVDGYTDDLGSAEYGLVLSRRRADAVAGYLRSQLVGAPVSIVSAGHGESSPVADNATASGRKQNRRVTITLPTA
jgi:outer membrane protein OmpA-like peptidoglycan-associated protein